MKAARNFLGQYDLNDNFTSPRRKICWKPTSLSGRVEKRAVTWGQKPLLDLTFFIYLVNKMLFLSGKIQGKFRECLWQPCIDSQEYQFLEYDHFALPTKSWSDDTFVYSSHDTASSCSGGHGDERSPQILAKAVQVHSEMLKGMYFA